MKRLLSIAALLMIASVAQAQMDDVHIVGVKVGNDLFGPNFTICHIQVDKSDGEPMILQVIVYGKYHAKFRAAPIDSVMVIRGTHTWFKYPDRLVSSPQHNRHVLMIRAFKFDWYKDKAQ